MAGDPFAGGGGFVNLFGRLFPWLRVPPAPSPGDAVAEARRRRAEAEQTRGEVSALSGALAEHRRRNHFGESLERAWGVV